MHTPGFHDSGPQEPTLQQMQEALFINGWRVSEKESGKSEFNRTYPRVNSVLQGNWRAAIFATIDAIRQEAPELAWGLGLTTDETNTDLSIKLSGTPSIATKRTHLVDRHLREKGFEEIDEAMLAEWQELKSDYQGTRPGSKEYYELTDRSKVLRELTIEAIRAYQRMVDVEAKDEENEALARLLDINRELLALEVEPSMHMGEKPIFFRSPVKRAEWAAGYLLTGLQEGYGFSALFAEDDRPSQSPISNREILLNLDELGDQLDIDAEDRD